MRGCEALLEHSHISGNFYPIKQSEMLPSMHLQFYRQIKNVNKNKMLYTHVLQYHILNILVQIHGRVWILSILETLDYEFHNVRICV
jgi:hypothetical protein